MPLGKEILFTPIHPSQGFSAEQEKQIITSPASEMPSSQSNTESVGKLDQYMCLLDTNFYRNLTTRKDSNCIKNFSQAVGGHELIRKIMANSVIPTRTPFSILEAIGITLPEPPIKPPKSLFEPLQAGALFSYINKEARNYYDKLDLIKKPYLLKRAREQSKYTNKNAKPFEEMFLFSLLKDSRIEEDFINHLAWDYVSKFKYPPLSQWFLTYYMFTPWFFLRNNLTSSLSHFRTAKKMWDMIYEKMLKESFYKRETIQIMNRAMRIKTNKDFLDCEIVHFINIGMYSRNKYYPVIAFTCDESDNILNRIKYYKSMIEIFIGDICSRINENKEKGLYEEVTKSLEDYKVTMDMWKPGVIVCCNKDLSFKEVLEVSEIQYLL